MATHAQIDANRRNSEKSTGPVSAEGKAASCRNALKSGLYAASTIIRGETAESFDELAAQYQKDFDPQTAVEQTLLDSLVAAAWILRRLVKVEAHLWERQFSGFRNPDPKTYLGDAYCNTSNNFARHQRRQDSISREYRAVLKELTRIQEARLAGAPPTLARSEPVPAPAPTPQPIDPEPVMPEFGFVPSNPPDTPTKSPAEPQRPAAAARYRPACGLDGPNTPIRRCPRRPEIGHLRPSARDVTPYPAWEYGLVPQVRYGILGEIIRLSHALHPDR